MSSSLTTPEKNRSYVDACSENTCIGIIEKKMFVHLGFYGIPNNKCISQQNIELLTANKRLYFNTEVVCTKFRFLHAKASDEINVHVGLGTGTSRG